MIGFVISLKDSTTISPANSSIERGAAADMLQA